MKTFTLMLVLFLNIIGMPLHASEEKGKEIAKFDGMWIDNSDDRSLREIPILGEIDQNFLQLVNLKPDRDLSILIKSTKTGIVVIKQDVKKEESLYFVIPIDELIKGETYRLEIRSSIPADYLYATLTKK